MLGIGFHPHGVARLMAHGKMFGAEKYRTVTTISMNSHSGMKRSSLTRRTLDFDYGYYRDTGRIIAAWTVSRFLAKKKN